MKGSAAGFVMKGPDHILAEGRIRMWKVQHWILWWKNQITYFLRVEQGWCERFSIEFCDKRTRSHTNWGWNKGVKFSAVGFVMKGPDHIQTEGGIRMWNVQQQVLWWKDQITHTRWGQKKVHQHILWWKDEITYLLRAEQECERFSSGFCNERTRLHTRWGQNKGAEGSAVDFVMKAPHHILPKGGTRVQKVQQWICGENTTSHTFWWWKQATTGSAGGFTVHGPDHILPDGGTRPEEISSGFCGEGVSTYPLSVKQGHERLSREFSGKRPDHIQTEGRTRPQEVQQWVLGQREQSTYLLRAEQDCKRSSTGFAVNGTDWDS